MKPQMHLGKDGDVKKVLMNGANLPLAGKGGFSIVESLVPDGELKDWGRVSGKVSPGRKGGLFTGSIPQAALELTAEIRHGDYIDVRGEVRDTSGADRALNVTFQLPLKLAGWRWEWTAARTETIKPRRVYPTHPDDFLYLGKKGDGFADEDHGRYCIRTNKLPFTAVSRGKRGLAIACPLHEPRVFLISASETGLAITFSLGVTPITKKFPSRATFHFVIYSIDGEWGIRSAAESYQKFFPEFYRSRCRRHGNIDSVPNPDIDPPPAHLEDMGIAYIENDYQWTNGEIAESTLRLARKLGVGPGSIFHWRGPWYWFNQAPGDVTRDAQLASMKAQAEGRIPATAHGKNNQLCGCPNELSARAAYNSYLVDHQGKLERIRFQYPQYSCWLLPLNMDVNLPKPNRAQLATEWQYRYIRLWKKKGFRGPFGIAYDAFDDFSGFRRLNFRREHLAVMDIPATFDPVSGRLCQVKGFTDIGWARLQGGLAHKAGGSVMSNVNLEHAMMFGGQHIDVIFRERRSVDHTDERLSVHRMLLGPKPISFQGGGRQPGTPKAWTREARRLLVFGMAPGASLGNWEEVKAHMPVVGRVAAAGWRPVPYARAKGLWIERFGDKPGRMYFTVWNPGRKPVRAAIRIDARSLGLAAKRATVAQVSPDSAAKFSRNGDVLSMTAKVSGKEMIVLAVKTA